MSQKHVQYRGENRDYTSSSSFQKATTYHFQDYKKMSPLATCLGDKMTPEMEDVEKLENLSDCLTSRSLVAIDAKWQIDNKVFSFGGRNKSLKVWIGKTHG